MSEIGPTFHITTASDGSHDVWLDFVGDNGRMCSLSIATIAERSGPIVRDTLRGWASRAICSRDVSGKKELSKNGEVLSETEHQENEASNDYVSDDGQFGVGA